VEAAAEEELVALLDDGVVVAPLDVTTAGVASEASAVRGLAVATAAVSNPWRVTEFWLFPDREPDDPRVASCRDDSSVRANRPEIELPDSAPVAVSSGRDGAA